MVLSATTTHIYNNMQDTNEYYPGTVIDVTPSEYQIIFNNNEVQMWNKALVILPEKYEEQFNTVMPSAPPLTSIEATLVTLTTPSCVSIPTGPASELLAYRPHSHLFYYLHMTNVWSELFMQGNKCNSYA